MSLCITKLNPDLIPIVYEFFQSIEKDNFHPHSFEFDDVGKLCNYIGNDLYYVIMNEGEVVAYGMLRGWDAGFVIPMLGIYVSKKYRGTGVGKLFMSFLHMSAKLKGANQVMLKVYRDNYKAINLYTLYGYVFSDFDEKQLMGVLDL